MGAPRAIEFEDGRRMMHSLEKKVLSNIRKHGLSAGGNLGIVAVSGGADSLALLLLLHALREKLGLQLEVLHFNHGLRPESPREAEWVAGRAADLGLPFHLRETVELKKRRGGVQEAARNWRREESRRLLDQLGAGWVATGHQLDDQAETILLKLMRGSHLENLRGMDWRADGFVRPLLNITHSELTAYLNARSADWLEDPSNQYPGYKRNRVRNELLPLMEEISGGGLADRLQTLAAQAEALERILRGFPPPDQSRPSETVHWISADPLRALPALAATTALHNFITQRMPGALPHATLQSAVELLHSQSAVWSLSLSKGRRLRCAGERLILEPLQAAARKAELLEWNGRQIEYPSGLDLRVCKSPCGAEEALRLFNLPGGCSLLVRERARGDRFHPAWKKAPVKLKDFLRDQQVPLWQRDNLPCVVLDGRLIAIYPNFVAHGFESPRAKEPPLCLHLALL